MHLAYLTHRPATDASRGWQRSTRVLWNYEKDTWFYADAWYASLRSVYNWISEPWASFLMLVRMYDDPIARGTALVELAPLDQMWKRYAAWAKRGDNRVLATMDKATETVYWEYGAYIAFFAHIHGCAPETGAIDQAVHTSFQNARRSAINALKRSSWRVILTAHLQGPVPLHQAGLNNERNAAVQAVNAILSGNTQALTEASLVSTGLSKETSIALVDLYAKKAVNQASDALDGIESTQIEDIPHKLHEFLPASDPLLGPISIEFRKLYLDLFRGDEPGHAIAFALWSRALWHLVYFGAGDSPYFAHKRWYGPASTWGFSDEDGSPLVGEPNPEELQKHYEQLESSRIVENYVVLAEKNAPTKEPPFHETKRAEAERMGVPKAMWDAYAFRRGPETAVILSSLFKHDANTVKAAMALFTTMVKHVNAVPWYAETWLREAVYRCWALSRLGIDLNQVTADPTLVDLGRNGALGLLLDHFSLRVAALAKNGVERTLRYHNARPVLRSGRGCTALTLPGVSHHEFSFNPLDGWFYEVSNGRENVQPFTTAWESQWAASLAHAIWETTLTTMPKIADPLVPLMVSPLPLWSRKTLSSPEALSAEEQKRQTDLRLFLDRTHPGKRHKATKRP